MWSGNHCRHLTFPRNGEAVNAIEAIGDTIAEIDQISGEIAAAVDQQDAATREIAGNLQQAADRTKDVNKSIVSVNRGFRGGQQRDRAPARYGEWAVVTIRAAEVRARRFSGVAAGSVSVAVIRNSPRRDPAIACP